MHPVRAEHARRGSALAAAALAVAVAAFGGAAGGCAHEHVPVPEPTAIEQLRVRITKTRHAIKETQATIARSKGSPHLPELYVRLAELLSEEARYHNEVAYEREERKSAVIHAPQVRLLKEQAIATYRRAEKLYPDSALVPRILFNIGHEQRELGDFDGMVLTLEDLAARFPGSPLTDEALLVLGDYHFDKGDLERSAAAYERIVARPLSRVSGLAYYKLGWVWVNKSTCARALDGFEHALDASARWEARKAELAAAPGGAGVVAPDAPSTGQAIDVRREALVDLIYCYTQERDTAQALPYLRSHAADRYAYVAALRRMAERLSFMNQRDPGLEVARELVRLSASDADRLDDARLLYGFLRVVEGAPAPGLRASDVRLLVDTVVLEMQRPTRDQADRDKLEDEFEHMARDLLTTHQEAAQALPDEVARKRALGEVAGGYVVYLDAFQRSAARVEVTENLAETYALLGDDLSAGRRYLELADLAAEPAARKKALLSALGHLQRALEAEGPREQVGRVVARAALRRAGVELLGGELDASSKRTVELAVAYTFFDEGRYDEAIDLLSALTHEFPRTEEGDTAAFLALDAYEAAGDWDGLIVAGQRLLAPNGPLTDAARAKVQPAVARAEAKKLDELALEASGEGGADVSVLERFAERYQGTNLGERALVDAFVAARAVGDNDALQRLGGRLVQQYPDSEQTSGIISSLARNAVANLDYEQAIAAFEKAAATEASDSAMLLVTAAELKDQLGDAAGATEVFKQALARAKNANARAQVAEHLAAHLEATGAAPNQVVALLGPLAGEAGPDVLATLGLAQVELGQADEAEKTFQGVLDGRVASSVEAKARAQYGNAEAMASIIASYAPDGSVESLNELVTLIEVAQQGYLNAARQGSAFIAATALARLGKMAQGAAAKLASLPMPAALGPDEAAAVKAALGTRAQELRELAESARTTCAEQGFRLSWFGPVVRGCLKGELPASMRLQHDAIRPRRGGARGDVPALRAKLAESPQDPAVLESVGAGLLDAGDPHVARLVLARATAAGGGAKATNLLGIAEYGVGNTEAALEAFARAAEAGLAAGRENMQRVFTELGLSDAAATAGERYAGAKDGGGRLLGGGR
ncbi:MAG: tetratricopeptide repeat protein [Deltaproteobacteria bacterium]|nr:tetratricopeptide repeat protein [Deltaproteobacteria bacterium]